MLSQMTKNVLMVGGGAAGGAAVTGGFWAYFSGKTKKQQELARAAAEQAERELDERITAYVSTHESGDDVLKTKATLLGRPIVINPTAQPQMTTRTTTTTVSPPPTHKTTQKSSHA